VVRIVAFGDASLPRLREPVRGTAASMATSLRALREEAAAAAPACCGRQVHPSAILRQRTDEDRHREMAQFVEDLRLVTTVL